MNDLSLQFLAPDVWKWALVLIPAVCLAFWAYYRLLAPLSAPARGALWILRALAFFLVIFALWQPTVSYREPDRGKPRLAVLVDHSGSMSLPATDPSVHTSRAAEAAETRDQITERLGRDYDLEWYGFGTRLESGEGDSTLVAAGPTSIGSALEEVLVRSSSRPVHGVVLVSDGVNTDGRDPVRVAKGSPIPFFTLPVGPETLPPDLEIRKVRTNNRAFAGEPLPLEVTLSSNGMDGQTGKLVVSENGEIIEEREFQILGDKGLEQSVKFEFRPKEPGWSRYEVRALIENDVIAENDLRQVAVEVMERKTRVLCVGDAVDWDYGFLRRVFEADTTLGYDYLVRTAGGNYKASGNKPPKDLPTKSSELEDYAAVVLVSSGGARLPQTFLESLSGFVSRGGGLLVVGGPGSSGEWSSVDSFQRILPGRVVERAGGSHPLASVELTAQGMRHPVTALRDNPSQTAALFASLPPIWKARHALNPKGNAKSLLRYRGDAAGPTAFVVGFGGRGKVGWFHGRGLWRWQLTAAGADLPPYLFTDFVVGTVRWLAEPAIRERFQVEPGRRVYPNGERVSFTANLWNTGLQPVEGAEIQIGIQSADTTAAPVEIEMAAASEPGSYEGRGPGLPPGEYAYSAVAVDEQGTELGRSDGTFWVEPMGPEYARIVADHETMRQIAGESAGQSFQAASLTSLAESIPESIRRLGRIREIELWNHWVLFALFVLVLCTEWFLRRRRGLA